MPLDEQFWQEQYEGVYSLLSELFISSATAGASAVFSTLGEIGLGTDEAEVYHDIWSWAAGYLPGRAALILQTTREAVELVIGEWDGKDPIWLRDNLEPIFNSDRAQTIGISETTVGFSVGNLLAWSGYGIIESAIWITAEDERVCPVCESRNQTEYTLQEALYGGASPPAHPRCRCWMEAILHLANKAAKPILDALLSHRMEWAKIELIARVV